MTDQTVSVPVDLLKNLKERYPLNASSMDGPIKALADLIPVVHKVGDVVDGTDTAMAALPPRTVLTDRDGDLVVAFGEGTNGSPARRITDGGRQTDAFITSYYAPYTIVYLPEPRD